jgi:hypothetical protein
VRVWLWGTLGGGNHAALYVTRRGRKEGRGEARRLLVTTQPPALPRPLRDTRVPGRQHKHAVIVEQLFVWIGGGGGRFWQRFGE